MYSIHVTREALIKIIVDGTTFSAEQVAAILPPHNKGDHQNADSMVKLLLALSELCARAQRRWPMRGIAPE